MLPAGGTPDSEAVRAALSAAQPERGGNRQFIAPPLPACSCGQEALAGAGPARGATGHAVLAKGRQHRAAEVARGLWQRLLRGVYSPRPAAAMLPPCCSCGPACARGLYCMFHLTVRPVASLSAFGLQCRMCCPGAPLSCRLSTAAGTATLPLATGTAPPLQRAVHALPSLSLSVARKL